jgi:hypothetical protein
MGKEADKYLAEFEEFLEALPGSITSQRKGLSDPEYIHVLEFAISKIKTGFLPLVQIMKTLWRAQVHSTELTAQNEKALREIEEMTKRLTDGSDEIVKINASLQKELAKHRQGRPVTEPFLSAYISILKEMDGGQIFKVALFIATDKMAGKPKQKANLEHSFTAWCSRQKPSIHYSNPKDRERALSLLKTTKK